MRKILDWLGRHDRSLVGAGLLAITVLCWMWIVPMARDMYGPMTGPSAWMMAATWDARYVMLLWAMWAVMMAGMMLPSAFPMLLLYDGVLRRAPDAQRPAPRVAAMTAGYLLVAGGVMNLGVIAALTIFVLVEKTAPFGSYSSRGAGLVLIALGLWMFVR